jgi:DNA-binding PadR family transcriptional regulator
MKAEVDNLPDTQVHAREDPKNAHQQKYTNPTIAAHILHFLYLGEKRAKDIVDEIVSNPNMPSVSPSNVHLAIKQLRSNGLIRRTSDSSKRMTMYELTEDGKAEVEISIGKSRKRREQLLSRVSNNPDDYLSVYVYKVLRQQNLEIANNNQLELTVHHAIVSIAREVINNTYGVIKATHQDSQAVAQRNPQHLQGSPVYKP